MTDPIQEAAVLAARGVGELRDANATLTARVTELDKAYCIAMAELEMTQRALDKMQQERDFYQRFTVTMVTQMNNIGTLVADCTERAKQASYRPNGAVPAQIAEAPDDPSPPGPPIPGFLAQGPREHD